MTTFFTCRMGPIGTSAWRSCQTRNGDAFATPLAPRPEPLGGILWPPAVPHLEIEARTLK